MNEREIKSGHDLANMAKHYEDKGDWHNAFITHGRAAAQFEQATLNAEDDQTKNTMRLLNKNHARKSREMQRKTSQIQQQSPYFDMKELEQDIYSIQSQSNNHIGDSFAVLEEEDIEDPFNKFWGVVEPMVDKLSNPVALATPIDENDDSISIKSQQRKAVKPVFYDTSTLDEYEINRIQKEMSVISESFFGNNKIREDKVKDIDNGYIDTQYYQGLNNDGKRENMMLKEKIAKITRQIHDLEKKSVDSTVLKSSIIQFKNDVHKQALKILQTQESTIMTRSATTTGSPISKNIRTIGASTAEIVNRIRNLEEENKNLKSQNKKQDALMKKYRERWEKLKEGAKKRQPSSSSANATLLRNLASNNPSSSRIVTSSSPLSNKIE